MTEDSSPNTIPSIERFVKTNWLVSQKSWPSKATCLATDRTIFFFYIYVGHRLGDDCSNCLVKVVHKLVVASRNTTYSASRPNANAAPTTLGVSPKSLAPVGNWIICLDELWYAPLCSINNNCVFNIGYDPSTTFIQRPITSSAWKIGVTIALDLDPSMLAILILISHCMPVW